MTRAGVIWTLFCLFALVASQACPDEDPELKKWSEDSTWDGQIPQEGDDLVIESGDKLLLDTSPPPLGSITIQSGGVLVVADEKEISLSVKYIKIQGEMRVGSENCPFTGKLHITLQGNLGEYDIPGFGEKFIGVENGGVLEIHGEYRLPWTKITNTVDKVQYISNVRNIDMSQDANETDNVGKNIRALVIYVFNEQTGVLESAAQLVNTNGKAKDFPDNVAKAKQILDDIPAGKIIGLALKRRFRVERVDPSGLFDMLEQWAYGTVDNTSLQFRDYKFHGAWSLIKKQGDDASTQELLLNDDGKNIRIAELYHVENNIKFGVRSWVHTVKRGQCYSRGKSSLMQYSLPVINVVDDAQTWRTGDTVALMSTDFDWKQTEFGTIVDCPSCTTNQIQVNIEPEFTHFGEIYKNVDMRGEIALVNRNILIEGGPADKDKKIGGHIKFLKGFKTVQVKNVELNRMGQQTSLGNYPLHFHMCEDVDDRTKPSLLSGNSIHNSFARCITIHGTHGAQVKDNFCFNTLGHGYFLEDGGEKRTVLDGNLGAGQKRGNLIRSDMNPTTFWITNPQTYVRNNVAAGGEAHGFWFVYPNSPVGPSASRGFMDQYEAMHTAIFEFDNNVAHSNAKSGLFIDNILRSDGSLVSSNSYEPWNDPKDSESGAKMVTIRKLTAYKNMKENAWINGGLFKVTESSFSDSVIGLTFKRSSEQNQYIEKSVFIGDSPNTGSPTVISSGGASKTYPRSVPIAFADQPRQGFVFYHGPVFVDDTFFGDFEDTENYRSGALGFQRDNDGHSSPISAVSGIKFGFSDPSEGNRVFDGNATDNGFSGLDGDLIGSFRDTDGSVFSTGSQIVKDLPFHSTSNCYQRTNWKMMACTNTFGQVRLSWNFKPTGVANDVSIYRDDLPDNPIESDARKMAPFMAILGEGYGYLAKMNGNVPTSVGFKGLGFTKTKTARMGLCVPRDATIFVRVLDLTSTSKWNKWTKGESLSTIEDLDSSTNAKNYFLDSEVGVVFFNIMHEREYSSSDAQDCLDERCPSVVVKITGGDSSDSDCTSRAFDKYKRESRDSSPETEITALPTSDLYPPPSWGAGSSRD
ncbi:cell surface hyaluronidase-like [Saccostrea echinata]|uniref:cell surface hyaluronidase-like n=1 Tax=Saccostrea echinata TaxID=191078 RepID=UPI002A818F17|nr:cell surface hyaluronidase-like [Saccostrea echinata]